METVTWRLGDVGQSCDDFCSSVNYQCAERFWPLQPEQQVAVQNVSVWDCSNTTAGPLDSFSPARCSHADCGGARGDCWLASDVDSTDCAASDYRYQRLCPCGDLFINMMSAGSYPAFILWCTSALQVIFLLTFASYGDFGAGRKTLLKRVTWLGSAVISMTIFCLSSIMWWLAGLIRVGVGICFVLCEVYYNAYLPLLAAAHPGVQKLVGQERADKEIHVADEMSNKGFIVGYLGSITLMAICYVVLLIFECDGRTSTCTEIQELFWPCLCISFVGVWWSGFSLYSFKHLQTRGGRPFPAGANKCLVGWRQAWGTMCYIAKFRQNVLFMVAFFVSSDALQTIQNVGVFVSATKAGKDSGTIFFVILGNVGGIVGLAIATKIQQYFLLTNKVMLIASFTALALLSVLGGADVLDLKGSQFYILMTPVVLLMGSTQANIRAMYSSLTPVGMESAMFSFYAITDKGSALIGAFMIGVIHTSTGSYTGVFWYTGAAFLFSLVLLCFIDVKKAMRNAGRLVGEPEPPEAAPDGLRI
mmetsp:Transcript_125577/g.355243  ORF Transcript_125577/g.355243 Transcript_125577/m.355243 type:complete len:532 (-) Transcript_125577:131-1726(-)